METKNSSHLGKVMAELVIIIGFFVIISIFLLKLFTVTEKTRSDSENLSRAVIIAENTIEKLKAGDDILPEFYENGFKVSITESGSRYDYGTMMNYTVYVYDEDVLIYTLKTSVYETEDVH